ncbi:hypothetical protein COCMIDRAFT_110762, partial [Bipolaris oryzae ATCC 44560]
LSVKVLRVASLSDYSIIVQLAWVSQWHKAHAEDESYCQVGIFDIYLPVVYGTSASHCPASS